MRSSQRRYWWLNLLLFGLALVAWFALAPTKIGGRNTYLIIRGNSMEPVYHSGDFVIVRRSETFKVGQEAAYRHPSIGIVYHTIIGFNGDRAILQGYNNAWVDEFQPEVSDLLGTYWHHVPNIGRFFQLNQFPRIITVVVALILLLILWPRDEIRPKSSPKMNTDKTSQEDWLALFFVIALLCGGLVWFSYRQPLTTTRTQTVGYTQHVAFRYSAMASETVYDAPLVNPGEPLFRQLVDSFTIGVNYRLEAANASQLNGHYSLKAEVRDVNGWKRTIELVPPTAFEGPTAGILSQLSFTELQSIIDVMESNTGVERSVYRLHLKPEFVIEGFIAGHSISEQYLPELRFELNENELRMIDTSGSGQMGLLQSQSNALAIPIVEPNSVRMGTLQLQIAALRQLSIVLTALALVAILIVAWRMHAGESAETLADAHPNLFVDVTQLPTITTTATHVRLSSLADLIQVAYGAKQIILRQPHTTGVQYTILTDGVVYTFEQSAESSDVAAQPVQAEAVNHGVKPLRRSYV